jgi:hypothetical protein
VPPGAYTAYVTPSNVLARQMNALETRTEAVHAALEKSYALAWLAAQTGTDVGVKVQQDKKGRITLKFENCPLRQPEIHSSNHFNGLREWLERHPAAKRDTLLLPVRGLEREGDRVSLDLRVLKPAPIRVPEPANRIP